MACRGPNLDFVQATDDELHKLIASRGTLTASDSGRRDWPVVTCRQRRLLFMLIDWARVNPDAGDFTLRLSIAGAYFVGHQHRSSTRYTKTEAIVVSMTTSDLAASCRASRKAIGRQTDDRQVRHVGVCT
jgi:hypothetical protein